MENGNVKILIVDDVAVVRELMAALLSEIPEIAEVREASNTWEARLELSRQKPDIVFLDEVIPGESTDELIGEMSGANVYVILISGNKDGLNRPPQSYPMHVIGRLIKPNWDTLKEDRIRYQGLIQNAIKWSNQKKPINGL